MLESEFLETKKARIAASFFSYPEPDLPAGRQGRTGTSETSLVFETNAPACRQRQVYQFRYLGITIFQQLELEIKAPNLLTSNFTDSKFADYCKQELMALVNQFEFTQEVLPGDCTSASDLECLALMRDLDTRLNYKKLANPKTFRKKLKRYQELCKESASCDLKRTLLTMVEEKI